MRQIQALAEQAAAAQASAAEQEQQLLARLRAAEQVAAGATAAERDAVSRAASAEAALQAAREAAAAAVQVCETSPRLLEVCFVLDTTSSMHASPHSLSARATRASSCEANASLVVIVGSQHDHVCLCCCSAAMAQECAGLRSRLEAAQRHSRTLEAERNGAQERLAAAQAREQGLTEVGVCLVTRFCVQSALSYGTCSMLHLACWLTTPTNPLS